MKDKSAINLRKSMERGSIESETRVSEHVGDIMSLAKKKRSYLFLQLLV